MVRHSRLGKVCRRECRADERHTIDQQHDIAGLYRQYGTRNYRPGPFCDSRHFERPERFGCAGSVIRDRWYCFGRILRDSFNIIRNICHHSLGSLSRRISGNNEYPNSWLDSCGHCCSYRSGSLFRNTSAKFRAVLKGTWSAFKACFTGIGDMAKQVFGAIGDLIKACFNLDSAGISAALAKLKAGFSNYGKQIGRAFNEAYEAEMSASEKDPKSPKINPRAARIMPGRQFLRLKPQRLIPQGQPFGCVRNRDGNRQRQRRQN